MANCCVVLVTNGQAVIRSPQPRSIWNDNRGVSAWLFTLAAGTFLIIASCTIERDMASMRGATSTGPITTIARKSHGQLVTDDVAAILTGIANAPSGARAVNEIMGVRVP